LNALSSISSLVAVGLWTAILPTNAQVNVTQFHNHSSRDGLYVDSAFTQSAAANLTRDLNFDGTISGEVYAQPLYIEGGPGGRRKIVVVTELNNVYALDAVDGSVIWERNVGDPVSAGDLGCPTLINPVGITGTPIVDLASRALFLNAMTTPDGGTTKKHLIFSLNVDTGNTNSGWPVDVEATATYNGTPFTAAIQLQRPALGIVGNILYVPYGSFQDCGVYHGWLVGVPINNPASVTAWATSAIGGAIWGVGGVASDGTNPFVTTGNGFNTGGNWSGGQAVIRFQPGPIFTDSPADYWVPTNWELLDQFDHDLGGSGPLLVDVPNATPSHLVVALGKDGNAYLLNRGNLGGITDPVAWSNLSDNPIMQAAATYRTNQGTYVAYRVFPGNHLGAFRITATNPPMIIDEWGVFRTGCGSPFVTSTDPSNNMIVWVVGTDERGNHSGDQRLHGYDGDTGAVVFDGGGSNELMAGMWSYGTTGLAARGRIYVAGNNNKVYAFAVPGGTPTPTPTATATATVTPTATPTATATPTGTVTPTATPTATATPTGTVTPTATPTATATPTGTPTPTPTPPVTPTPTGTPTATPTPTTSPSPSQTPTATPRVTPRSRPTPRPRPTPLGPAKSIGMVDQKGREVLKSRPRP
jgi:PQQ enzyme-like repeat protein